MPRCMCPNAQNDNEVFARMAGLQKLHPDASDALYLQELLEVVALVRASSMGCEIVT